MEIRSGRARRRSRLVVHAVVLLAGLGVIVLYASPVRFYGWSWDFFSEWFTMATAVLFGGAMLPLMWLTAEKELGEPFSSWSDVVDAGIFWALFLVVAGVVSSWPLRRGRRSAGSDDR